MRQRSSASTVGAVSKHDAIRLKKTASTGMKSHRKDNKSSASMSIWGFGILFIGIALLLLRNAVLLGFDNNTEALSEAEKVAAFLDWFRGEGGNVSSSIAVKTFPGMGRGVAAQKSIEEKDELLFIPSSIIIFHDTIEQEWSSDPKLLKKMTKISNEQEELLTAFLLLEQAKGATSRWAPYLQLLPPFSSRNEVASPLLFSSNTAVESLLDERMVRESTTERELAKKAYSRFKRLFRGFVDNDMPQLSQYVWMRFLVNSRAFTIQGHRVLVPFGDFFNGKSHHEARQRDNGQRFLDFHDFQTEGMFIRADRSTMDGEQVFEDYGDNSNYVYFLHHGFLMQNNSFDCAALRLPSALEMKESSEDAEEILEAKKRALSRIRVEDAPLVCISRAGKVEDTDLLRIYSILHNMDAGLAAACNEAKSFSDCFPPDLMAADDAESQLQESTLLLNGVQQQLTRYHEFPSSEHNHETHSDRKHAEMFRLSREEILHDALDVLGQSIPKLEEEIRIQHEDDAVNDGERYISDKRARFLRWIARHNFPVNHLELGYVSDAVGLGAFATKPLAHGETYLSVPVKAVMNRNSALKSNWLRQTMQGFQEERFGVSRDEMLLLLHVLEESFGPDSDDSRWKPYLDMLPILDDEVTLGSPLFYEENDEQLEALKGTDLLKLVTNYRDRVAEAYKVLSQHLQNLSDKDALLWLTERRFRWAHATIDSRSIWWNSQRHLVPLLDMVNCQELNPKHKPHSTNLDSSGRHADTKASWKFNEGDEVVENYAQPNYIYLLYHGFVLDSNSHDCAHFHVELPRQQNLVPLLQQLEIFSWTSDVCVLSTDEKAVTRFASIALIASDPEEAIKTIRTTITVQQQAITSALKLVARQLQRLKSTTMETTNSNDFRTQAIVKYRQQQRHQLTSLRDALNKLQ